MRSDMIEGFKMTFQKCRNLHLFRCSLPVIGHGPQKTLWRPPESFYFGG
jgi:hypothetical protein